MAKHNKSVGTSSEGCMGKKSGQLSRPTRLMLKNDFSTSFTNKVKSNNDSLAKNLAKAKAIIEQQADEIKMQKASYNEVLMKKYAVEMSHQECVGKLETYITKSLHEVRSVLDTLISMKDEMMRTKSQFNGSLATFRYDLHQQRVSGLPQTQSVGPMVQGHSIKQPRISLSRINPRCPNGARVPAEPVPAVPAAADVVQVVCSTTQAASTQAASTQAASTSTSAAPQEPSYVNPTPLETMDMFYARARKEDPKEGPSSGKRQRPYKQPRVFYQESSDDDSDDYDEPTNQLCNRTSYSPTIMDETTTHSRLSTIVQELTPNLFDAEMRSSVPFLSQTTLPGNDESDGGVPDNEESLLPKPIEHFKLRVNCEVPNEKGVSPTEPYFLGFNENSPDSANRSSEELRSHPCNSLEWNEKLRSDKNNVKIEPSGVKTSLIKKPKKIESSSLKLAAAQTGSVESGCLDVADKVMTQYSSAEIPSLTPTDPCVAVSQSEQRIPKDSTNKKVTKSDPGCRKKAPQDPDWTPNIPKHSSSELAKRSKLKRHAANAIGHRPVEETPPLLFLHRPLVIVSKLDSATIAAAIKRPRTSTMERLPDDTEVEHPGSGRSLRRVREPTNYAERKLNVKLRRD